MSAWGTEEDARHFLDTAEAPEDTEPPAYDADDESGWRRF
jgi:hypothetical protein